MENEKFISDVTKLNNNTYSVNSRYHVCPDCGKKGIIEDYIYWEDSISYKDINPEQRIRLAMCKCGNIFLRDGVELLKNKSEL